MNLQAVQQFLSRTKLCGGLPPESLAALARGAKLRELANGETLIVQGQAGDSLYFVVDGRLEARMTMAELPPRVEILARIGRGEVVGEMAALSSEPRLCSVVAIRESRVVEIASADFLAIVALHPEALFRITHEIIKRAHEPVLTAAPIATVTLIPAGPRVDIEGFTDGLMAALSAWGSTALVRAKDAVGTALGDTLAENLTRLEQRHDRVIYQGLDWHPAWSRRTVRQADLILVIANADDDPALSDFERTALFCQRPVSAARIDLVLLYPSQSVAPRGTARWLEHRKVQLHHHVATNTPADFARLARLISGNTTHLVLSGGGARGFAHLGVLRAFEEAGIPIDFIGGTSMGAGIAAFRAMGWSTERTLETMRRFAPGAKDLTLPMLALFSGRKGTRALQAMCGDQQIEDLWLNYFAVSADLRHAEEFVHRRGPLWLALRASSSIPGIYPPVVWEDRWLVDGGALNNLPVDQMAQLGGGRIVAVDVSQEHALEFSAHQPVMISGWRLLWQWLNPFRRARRAPHIADILVRSGEIASVRANRTSRGSTKVVLTITPPVAQYRTLDFLSIDAIVEASYRHACAHMDDWKRVLFPRP